MMQLYVHSCTSKRLMYGIVYLVQDLGHSVSGINQPPPRRLAVLRCSSHSSYGMFNTVPVNVGINLIDLILLYIDGKTIPK